jgi:hypothetical protein
MTPTNILSYYCLCAGRDSNRTPPKYKPQIMPFCERFLTTIVTRTGVKLLSGSAVSSERTIAKA